MPDTTPASRELAALLDVLLQPHNFLRREGLRLESAFHPALEVPWEIHAGRLLGPRQTRRRGVFDVWEVRVSGDPLLSLKLDHSARRIHVTRWLECHVWEPYEASDNVILSREVRAWVEELVATVDLDRFAELVDLGAELRLSLFQALVGCSRLPLTSVEAPLPVFSLGQVAYLGSTTSAEPDRPLESPREVPRHFLRDDLTWLEKTKLVEFLLRSNPKADAWVDALLERWLEWGHTKQDLLRLFRSLFNDVALSPYTEFVARFLALLESLVQHGQLTSVDEAEVLSGLLLQVVRHLTAYDLKTFHHRGANYPDALLLDAVLKRYLCLLEEHPTLLDQARRRRAVRQAWLLRRGLEGLPVPAHPTSPGENARVLPPPFVRVPEEEILDPARRSRRLFDGEPLLPHLGPGGRDHVQRCLTDLEQPAELHELGMALFLARPFGVFKAPGEPDQTTLLAYEAFSLSVAEQRLQQLAEELHSLGMPSAYDAWREHLRASAPRGITLPPGPRLPRPGVVSLSDAGRVAADFVFLRTLSQSVRDVLADYDFSPLQKRLNLCFLEPPARLLILAAEPHEPRRVQVYDAAYQQRLELQLDPTEGYRRRAGREVLAAGLRVLRAWEAGPSGREHDLQAENVRLRPLN